MRVDGRIPLPCSRRESPKTAKEAAKDNAAAGTVARVTRCVDQTIKRANWRAVNSSAETWE